MWPSLSYAPLPPLEVLCFVIFNQSEFFLNLSSLSSALPAYTLGSVNRVLALHLSFIRLLCFCAGVFMCF